jgi:CspA family cold shock protein
MPKGTIRQIMDRGFGFIKTEEGKDLFFHRSECEGVQFSSLKVGQGVEFEIGQDNKGRTQAVKVRLTETQAPEPPPSQLGERESPRVIELTSLPPKIALEPLPIIELGEPPK